MSGRKNSLGLALILVCAFVGAIAQAQTTRPADYYGRVVGSDGKPVQGAMIIISQFKPELRGYATAAIVATDADGKFQFTGAPPGVTSTYAIVQAKGFGSGGGNLQDSSAEEPAVFNLRPATELHIRFADSSGKPVAGLKVWPNVVLQSMPGSSVEIPPDAQDRFAQITDSDGVCVLKDLPRDGTIYYTFADTQFALPDFNDRITLGSSNITDAGVKVLEPGGSIEGRITLANTGKGVSDVALLFDGMRQNPNNQRTHWPQTARTDSDGKYALKGLRSGQYSLRIELSQEQVQQYTTPLLESFSLAAGEHHTSADIALISGGVVTGKVTAAGAPVPDARIWAIVMARTSSDSSPPSVNLDGRMVRLDTLPSSPNSIVSESWVNTGKDGAYVMHVTPGQMVVQLFGAPEGYLIPKTPSTPSSVMTIEESQTITRNFELMIDPSPTLKGEVVDSDGKTASGAIILLEPPGARSAGASSMTSQTRSDADGHFIVRGVPIGTGVRARKGNSGTAEKIAVSDSNREDLKITLQKDALASAALHVVDNAGKPIPEAQISITQRMGNISMVMPGGVADEDGKLIASSLFPDMTYNITGRAKGYGNGTLVLQQLQAGKQIDAKLQLNKADSFVGGIVLDENQLPLMGIEVYVSAASTGSQTVKTDITGHFRADGIVAGDTVTVYTRVGNVRGQPQPERVPAGTADMILIHNSAATPQPTAGRRGP